uniref:Uncharacterized protein n=1 Tax=Solanum lycopersicum TaxID=4081 RepID=A0A3Q7F2I2_SOLLC
MPKEKGGLGFRSLLNVSKAIFDVDEVNQLMIERHWNEDFMLQLLSEDVYKYIQNVTGVVEDTEEQDSLAWMCTNSEKFTIRK